MTLQNLVRRQNIGDTLVIDDTGKKFDVRIDGTSIVSAVDGTLSTPAENAAGTSFTPAAGLTSTDTQAAIVELAGLLSGVAHTAITGIDLRATATPNQYLVEITWTDENGATQTTTDATPITLGGTPTIVSTDAGNLVTAGGDGGAFYDGPVVSADAGNLLVAGSDAGAIITGPGLKTAVENHVLDDCLVTDMFGDTIGTVTMWQP